MVRFRNYIFVKLSVIYLRYLIGFAFVFASIVKIKGERFTRIPADQPIGYFFEAMYQSGFYWNFLGWGQFIAGAVMMTQRFATVGAMMFFPIILNVFMITHSINFGSGTPVVTTLMLLGTIYLLLWDYKKWIILIQRDHNIKLDLTKEPEDKFMTDPVWTITGIVFVAITVAMNLMASANVFIVMFGILLAVGIAAFAIALVRNRKRKMNASLERNGHIQ